MANSYEPKKTNISDWEKLAEKESKGKKVSDLTWKSLEGINVKPLYSSCSEVASLERSEYEPDVHLLTIFRCSAAEKYEAPGECRTENRANS